MIWLDALEEVVKRGKLDFDRQWQLIRTGHSRTQWHRRYTHSVRPMGELFDAISELLGPLSSLFFVALSNHANRIANLGCKFSL